MAAFKCMAREGSVGANDPQDCDHPNCGCDASAKPSYEELTGFYNDLVSEKERYRTALEKIRYTEGVGRAVEKLALDALRNSK